MPIARRSPKLKKSASKEKQKKPVLMKQSLRKNLEVQQKKKKDKEK